MFDGAKRPWQPEIEKVGSILFKITHPTPWTPGGDTWGVARDRTGTGGNSPQPAGAARLSPGRGVYCVRAASSSPKQYSMPS